MEVHFYRFVGHHKFGNFLHILVERGCKIYHIYNVFSHSIWIIYLIVYLCIYIKIRLCFYVRVVYTRIYSSRIILPKTNQNRVIFN